MNKKIIYILFFIGAFGFSQEKASLFAGKWDIICTQTHNIYYNTITDSLSYSDEYRELIPGLIKDYNLKTIDSLNLIVISDNSNNSFEFHENGKFLRKENGNIIQKGKYKLKTSKKIIILNYRDRQNKKIKDFMEYSVQDKDLLLKIPFGKILRPTYFTLRKKV
ncbi:hypothetical protein [Tamlana flava]|uniref:hypothetical protein n=1 Tax=Tamlana flava TaxID=3158572 RepID=UPI00351BB475